MPLPVAEASSTPVAEAWPAHVRVAVIVKAVTERNDGILNSSRWAYSFFPRNSAPNLLSEHNTSHPNSTSPLSQS
jgi:hypothetical protein